MRTRVAVLASGIALLAATALPGFANGSETAASVTERVEVNASPKAVWEALKSFRKVGPGRKLLSYKEGEATISEEFDDLPVIGKTNIVYVEKERPLQEVDFKMISSDKVKEFDGYWKLTPTQGGNCTLVQLSSTTDTGIRMPFAATLTKRTARRTVEKRLSEIKRLAESIASNHNAI